MQKDDDEKLQSPVLDEVDYVVSVSNGSQVKLPRSRWAKKLLSWGVEARGIDPIPLEERVDTQFHKIFFIWMSSNANILSFSAGTLGPVGFGLSLRASCLVIFFFNLLCTIPPAYLSTWGPKLGMRQMCSSRYTFGYYLVSIPSLLALIGGCGFCVLNSILGGQTLSSVSGGSLSWTVGIVIIAVVSLIISFFGYTVLGWYERFAWFPMLIVFAVAAGLGGKHFVDAPATEPVTARSVLSFGASIAGFVITWSGFASDYTAYYHPRVSSWRIFTYSYLGLFLPTVSLQTLGAAAAASAPYVPAWEAGYTGGNVGGLMGALLQPVGGFGKFLTVLLALSVMGNNAPTIYSLCLSCQTCVPPLVRVPRYVFSLLATAIIIPLAIAGQHKFYDALSNFLGLIGYWATAWIAAILVEHLLFRHGSFAEYDTRVWDKPRRLPTGIAALGAAALSFALIVPCMDQVWWVGPIAAHTGDIGFEVAFAVTVLLYPGFRWVERRYWGA